MFGRILEEDPYRYPCSLSSNASTYIHERNSRDKVLCIHISTLVELRLKTELFYCAHKLVEDNSAMVISWYAVACYYYACGGYEEAKKMFRYTCTGLALEASH